VSVIDFGLAGTVTPLFPIGGAEPLKPGTSFDFLTIPGQRVTFEMPHVYPFAPDGDLPVMQDGIETLKVFITKSPASFEFLEQVGTRNVEQISAIQALFLAALPMTREGRRESDTVLGPVDDWTTIELPFRLTQAAKTQ
jgi:hypothetical protein